MAEPEFELSFLDASFAELEQTDQEIADVKNTYVRQGTIEADELAINKRKLDVRRQEVVSSITKQTYEQDDDQLSAAHKFIITDTVDHTWKPSLEESKQRIREGFAVYERVRDNVELTRGIVAVIGSGAISLFESHGSDDINMDREGVSLQLRDGYKAVLETEKHKSFPSVLPVQAEYILALLPRYGAGYPADRMRTFDPESDKFQPHFQEIDILGEPKGPQLFWLGRDGQMGEQPADGLDDAGKYAIRLAQYKLLNATWLDMPLPSETLRDRVTQEFSRVYMEVLCSQAPWDTEKHLHVEHASYSDFTSMKQCRERSLASYDKAERDNVYYAAGTTASEVEGATRERIKKMSLSTRADHVAKALQAGRIMDAFFESLQ